MFPDIIAKDFDSALYGWRDKERRIRHPKWPGNFVQDILKASDKLDVLYVSSHEEVRSALVEMGVWFYCVYPPIDAKREYLERYRGRGENIEYLELLSQKYEEWIRSMERQTGCSHVVVPSGCYLSDVLPEIIGNLCAMPREGTVEGAK